MIECVRVCVCEREREREKRRTSKRVIESGWVCVRHRPYCERMCEQRGRASLSQCVATTRWRQNTTNEHRGTERVCVFVSVCVLSYRQCVGVCVCSYRQCICECVCVLTGSAPQCAPLPRRTRPAICRPDGRV